MSAGPVIVGEVAGQGAAQMSFAQDDDMIETLAADRADEPLGKGVLPRAGGRRQHFTNPHALQPLPEHVTVDAVAIAKRSEEHTSELQSPCNLVCRLLLEKKKTQSQNYVIFTQLAGGYAA